MVIHSTIHFRPVCVFHAQLVADKGLCEAEAGTFKVKEKKPIMFLFCHCVGSAKESDLVFGVCKSSSDNLKGETILDFTSNLRMGMKLWEYLQEQPELGYQEHNTNSNTLVTLITNLNQSQLPPGFISWLLKIHSTVTGNGM